MFLRRTRARLSSPLHTRRNTRSINWRRMSSVNSTRLTHKHTISHECEQTLCIKMKTRVYSPELIHNSDQHEECVFTDTLLKSVRTVTESSVCAEELRNTQKHTLTQTDTHWKLWPHAKDICSVVFWSGPLAWWRFCTWWEKPRSTKLNLQHKEIWLKYTADAVKHTNTSEGIHEPNVTKQLSHEEMREITFAVRFCSVN